MVDNCVPQLPAPEDLSLEAFIHFISSPELVMAASLRPAWDLSTVPALVVAQYCSFAEQLAFNAVRNHVWQPPDANKLHGYFDILEFAEYLCGQPEFRGAAPKPFCSQVPKGNCILPSRTVDNHTILLFAMWLGIPVDGPITCMQGPYSFDFSRKCILALMCDIYIAQHATVRLNYNR